MKDMREKKRK